jgi:imidazolonepropionase-like amidohydrolase
MTLTLFENARIFDGFSDQCADGMSVLVEGGLIREVSAKSIKASSARIINVKGRTLMPGLIDLHIHAYASDVNVQRIDLAGDPYRTAHAGRMLGHALDCGFTTVRDIAGGDWSLAQAIEDKLIRAPRFFYVGKALSMTGGHGDFRQMNEGRHTHGYCSCGNTNALCVVADGVDECVKCVREELRRGAHCIKIMASGGVASPADPIWCNQYSEEETRAIVRECLERRTYVSAHCHPANSIRRSIEFGVRCIEHGTLIDDETAKFAAERGAYVVPTLAIISALIERGTKIGLPPLSQAKVELVGKQAISGLDSMRRAGVKVAFGSDLMGETYTQQCQEFKLRSEVYTPIEILRQATSMAAEVLMQDEKLGCIRSGAHADIIVVDGDPTRDISLLVEDGRKLSLIMRAGELVKDTLSA